MTTTLIRQPLNITREALGRLFFQRCFYLFFMLLALIAVAPFLEQAQGGAIFTSAVNAFVILSAVGQLAPSLGGVLKVAAAALKG